MNIRDSLGPLKSGFKTMFTLFSKFTVLLGTNCCFLHDLFFIHHWLEFDLLFVFSHLDETISFLFRNICQTDSFIWVSSCSAYTMDISDWAYLAFAFSWLWEVDDQGDCSDINTSTNCFCSEKDLDLSVSQTSNSGCFCPCTIVRTIVSTPTNSAPCMNIVDVEIMFSFGVCLSIVDNESILLFKKNLIECLKFSYFIEEDDDLEFLFLCCQKFKNFENWVDLFSTLELWIKMSDSFETHVFIFRIQLNNRMCSQVILDESPEIGFLTSCRSDQELNIILFTLEETLLFSKTLRICLNKSELSYLILSHSSKTTHLSSERSIFSKESQIFLVSPTIICPYLVSPA